MPIRHLSYISTDLFWTKISTANIKVAFLSLGQGSFVWEKPFYIQSHKFCPIQKICGSVTKKFFVQNPKSAIHQLAQKPPTVQMGFLTGQIFNHASHPASDSHGELESVPTRSKSHQLAKISHQLAKSQNGP